MRDSSLVVLTVTLLTFNVASQVTSVKEYPAQFNESKQVWEEVVENQGSKTIVGMHTTFNCLANCSAKTPGSHNGSASASFDPLSMPFYTANEVHEGLAPGGVMVIIGQDPAKWSGGVDAVVFSDGHSEGNSRFVNEYQQHWGGVHQGIIVALPLLAKVANQEADLAEVEDVLRDRKESIPEFVFDPNGTFDWKRMGERLVYVDLELLLRSVRDAKAASDSTPQPQPRSDEIEANGISRKQERKLAIYLVKKLQEWKSALESGLGSPAAN